MRAVLSLLVLPGEEGEITYMALMGSSVDAIVCGCSGKSSSTQKGGGGIYKRGEDLGLSQSMINTM